MVSVTKVRCAASQQHFNCIYTGKRLVTRTQARAISFCSCLVSLGSKDPSSRHDDQGFKASTVARWLLAGSMILNLKVVRAEFFKSECGVLIGSARYSHVIHAAFSRVESLAQVLSL